MSARAITLAIAGRVEQAREAAEEAGHLAERLHYPVGQAAALEALATTAENVEECRARPREARELWHGLGRPLDAAICDLLLGHHPRARRGARRGRAAREARRPSSSGSGSTHLARVGARRSSSPRCRSSSAPTESSSPGRSAARDRSSCSRTSSSAGRRRSMRLIDDLDARPPGCHLRPARHRRVDAPRALRHRDRRRRSGGRCSSSRASRLSLIALADGCNRAVRVAAGGPTRERDREPGRQPGRARGGPGHGRARRLAARCWRRWSA